MLIIAHRGASGDLLENTLPAFSRAIDLGCSMAELDIHVCKSGELIVFHDETLTRIAGRDGAVAQWTLEELKALDLGEGVSIPTLEEVLLLCRDKMAINIELKGENTFEPCYTLLEKISGSDKWKSKCIVSSLDPSQIMGYHKLDSEIRLGLIAENLGAATRTYPFPLYSLHVDKNILDSNLKMFCSRAGYKLYSYTINDAVDFDLAINLNIDGIFTDYPEKYLKKI